MRCFISTDFPCPEPPMMMLILPRSMSRFDAPEHLVRAEALADVADPDADSSSRRALSRSSTRHYYAASTRMMSVRK